MNIHLNLAPLISLIAGRGGAEKLVNGLGDISASMGGASCPQTGAERDEKTPP